MVPDSDLARLPIETMNDLRARLRDAHYTTYNTLNTIFTGGLVAYLLRRVLEMPAAQRPWLLVLATLLVIIACWSGLFRLLALLRFASRMSDAMVSFACGTAVYVMVSRLDEGAHAWLQVASMVALFGGLGTLNMLRGARTDAFNAHVLHLIDKDMRRAAWARLAMVPILLALSFSPIHAQVLAALALAGSAGALAVDELVWTRTVAHTQGQQPTAEA
jgi:amino acid permease